MAKHSFDDEYDKSPSAQREEEILAWWNKEKIFQKTLEKEAPEGEFVFYEGPPTANGRPGIHHLESRTFKDVVPRYKTMRGYHVRRKAGWDTHGLPVELEVEKQLGLSSKKEIEDYGIEKFNEQCKENVWKYVDEWRAFTERIAFWLDLDNPYVTYHPSYIESLWHIVGKVDEQGLLEKDYKVVPWCPRCGTGLSSHELAQGYADVKDLSVTVKHELVDEPGTYLLAWTTTPWTLPGNVALAVGKDIEYVKIKLNTEGIEKPANSDEIYVIAKELLDTVVGAKDYDLLDTLKGKDLIDLEYKPLFSFLKDATGSADVEGLENAFKVYEADFVTTEEGTGIVHTAVMYGQDDFELGNKVGLPKYHLVDETGHFTDDTGYLAGKFVKDEETDVAIIKDLAHRDLLFAKEKHAHTYPHCWRCKTPLIYYARDSWYIRMSELRSKLLEANETINWEPSHIKEGRFGEWLREVKDWAISRERYWGTPLPVWMSEDGNEKLVVDSLETLSQHMKTSGNTYLFMRHGQSEGNLSYKVSLDSDAPDDLTEEGCLQVKAAVSELKKHDIDLVVASPFLRTKHTAEIVRDEFELPQDALREDARLGEYLVGDGFAGKSWDDAHKARHKLSDPIYGALDGGESLADLKRRSLEVMYELEENHKDKTILVVTHSGVLRSIESGLSLNTSFLETHVFANAEIREYDFVPLPVNGNMELDLHRPYIDDVVLISENGTELKRVPEVMDVWFDSGAMPFAQDHYPFDISGKELVYPADYISEAIDQTRGWFYTLLAVGTLMKKSAPYKNVISLGHILDAEGQKMSKSKGNTVNPWEMISKYGVDVLRFWMVSVNQPGEAKNFDERTVDEVNKKVFNLLYNVLSFYKMYADEGDVPNPYDSPHVLDVWICTKLNVLIRETTNSLDNYLLVDPARAIREFVGDFSQWYIRRSRDRFKEESEDKYYAQATTRYVLVELAKLLAPFAPFTAEHVYRTLRDTNDPESVHLCKWPDSQESRDEDEVLEMMENVREIISQALQERAGAGIKVRQPLTKLTIRRDTSLFDPYEDLVKEEVNVKAVVYDPQLPTTVELDTRITDELREEGEIRELIRTIQQERKKAGVKVGDDVHVEIIAPNDLESTIKKYEDDIISTTNLSGYDFKKGSSVKVVVKT